MRRFIVFLWQSVIPGFRPHPGVVGAVAESLILRLFKISHPPTASFTPEFCLFFCTRSSRNGNSDVGRRGRGQSLRKLADERTFLFSPQLASARKRRGFVRRQNNTVPLDFTGVVGAVAESLILRLFKISHPPTASFTPEFCLFFCTDPVEMVTAMWAGAGAGNLLES